jgi:hypothetical protein
MERAVEEVIASQKAMLSRVSREEDLLPDARLATMYEDKLRQVDSWLSAQPNIHVHRVHYAALIREPGRSAAAVASFLGGGLNQTAMVSVVEPALYRQRGNSG